MKKISILSVLILLFVLTGCSSKVKGIQAKNIFTQKEDLYYVYFYKKDCPACENVKPKIYEYVSYSNTKKGRSVPKIYQVDVMTMPNLNAQEDWKEKILGTHNVLELTIGSTPTLILVQNHSVNKVIVGRNAITQELDTYLGT